MTRDGNQPADQGTANRPAVEVPSPAEPVAEEPVIDASGPVTPGGAGGGGGGDDHGDGGGRNGGQRRSAVTRADVQVGITAERHLTLGAARMVAIVLLGILAGAVILQYVSLWVVIGLYRPIGEADVAAFKEVASFVDRLFSALLPVIAGLVGSAVTYYFARETTRR
jgi:hypothetical protein